MRIKYYSKHEIEKLLRKENGSLTRHVLYKVFDKYEDEKVGGLRGKFPTPIKKLIVEDYNKEIEKNRKKTTYSSHTLRKQMNINIQELWRVEQLLGIKGEKRAVYGNRGCTVTYTPSDYRKLEAYIAKTYKKTKPTKKPVKVKEPTVKEIIDKKDATIRTKDFNLKVLEKENNDLKERVKDLKEHIEILNSELEDANKKRSFFAKLADWFKGE